MWQNLQNEMGAQGLDIVTVALDTDPDAARAFAEAAKSTHPSPLDQALLTVELFAFTNVADYGSTKRARSSALPRLPSPAEARTPKARASSRTIQGRPAGSSRA